MSIYYAMVPGISKSERAGLYYIRSIMVLAFSSIFVDEGDDDDNKVSLYFDFSLNLNSPLSLDYLTLIYTYSYFPTSQSFQLAKF